MARRRLFRHLAVFVDGVDLDTAEQLAEQRCRGRDPGSALARLVDASMLEVTFTGATRYRMLETLRAFGLDRVAAAGEHDQATGHLIRWAIRLTARIAVDVTTEREPEADAALRREVANLRAAWRSARDRGPGDVEAVEATVALVTNLSEAIAYPDLAELRAGPTSWPQTSPPIRRSRRIRTPRWCWPWPPRTPTTAAITAPPSGSSTTGCAGRLTGSGDGVA